MDKKLIAALNNLWVVIRNIKLLGDEHDQLRNDFELVRETLETQAKKQGQDDEDK